jgi:hypothetical protein
VQILQSCLRRTGKEERSACLRVRTKVRLVSQAAQSFHAFVNPIGGCEGGRGNYAHAGTCMDRRQRH